MSEQHTIDPLVGWCPRCGNASPEIGYHASGWSNIEHPEWVADFDSHALCHACRTRWVVGHLCNPPSDGDLVLRDGEPWTRYKEVVPMDISMDSAAAYFASWIWAKEHGLDPDNLGSDICIQLMADDMQKRNQNAAEG